MLIIGASISCSYPLLRPRLTAEQGSGGYFTASRCGHLVLLLLLVVFGCKFVGTTDGRAGLGGLFYRQFCAHLWRLFLLFFLSSSSSSSCILVIGIDTSDGRAGLGGLFYRQRCNCLVSLGTDTATSLSQLVGDHWSCRSLYKQVRCYKHDRDKDLFVA